jgi:hypothetical protein
MDLASLDASKDSYLPNLFLKILFLALPFIYLSYLKYCLTLFYF